MKEVLKLSGVKENNLKDLSLTLPHDTFVAITGVSGSGKSTLAFDVIYAEGGRRYIETFSPYTRQFLDRLHKPDILAIEGARPALALEQRNKTTSSRSTVGTITEINDYIKVAWAELATLYCPTCNIPVERDEPKKILAYIKNELDQKSYENVLICFTFSIKEQISEEAIVGTLQSEGFLRFYDNGSIKKIEEITKKHLSKKSIIIVVERLKASTFVEEENKKGILLSLAQTYKFGHKKLSVVLTGSKEKILTFSDELHCSGCDTSYPAGKPSLFSFNSPLGACPTCHGFGKTLSISDDLIIPNQTLSLEEGAIHCWSTPSTLHEKRKLLTFCKEAGIDTHVPFAKLSNKEKDIILHGIEKGAGKKTSKGKSYKGVYHWFKKLERKKYKMHVRVFLSHFREEKTCADCQGLRLKPEARYFKIRERTIQDIWNTPIDELLSFFMDMLRGNEDSEFHQTTIGEIVSRLEYLMEVGLGYLTLDRQAKTLSGGEFQRVNLTTILGSRLVNTSLVLDEPTIGLHSRDTERLIATLKKLRDRGNSLFVVEHDQEVIKNADYVLDLGPASGKDGGNVVFAGPVSDFTKSKTSLTANHLEKERALTPLSDTCHSKKSLVLSNCAAHNLKNIDVAIPLERFVVVSGVSGSGKSTLIQTLESGYKKIKNGAPRKQLQKAGLHLDAISGLEHLDNVILIDQSPVGKSPRSNPATYTKVWDLIRDALANTQEAKERGFTKSFFSFNTDGGRCPECKGAGAHKIEMQFLADVFVQCEACGGSRFQDKVLHVRFHGKNVIDFLSMTLDESLAFFHSLEDSSLAKKALELLSPLVSLGLGYLTLGHPLSALSGGEAQRLKLASYLSQKTKEKLLFILDEPTTGLHPHNIEQLLSTLQALLAHGHSILCVEHNIDVIKSADWIIDLGPEGGKEGGEIIAEGVPEELLKDTAKVNASYTLSLLANLEIKQAYTRKSNVLQFLPDQKSSQIKIIGARHHNLKDVSVNIPKNKITLLTGVSGSGKSSLAFDILFAEGQRRYIDCLSPYARQFIKSLERADVDTIYSLPPTIAVSQKTAPPLGVSTIATTTEIYQYLRLLFAKVGIQHCPEHNLPITSSTAEDITDKILSSFSDKRLFIYAPVVSGRKGHYNELFNRALKLEIREANIDGKITSLSSELRLERHKLHWISFLVASLNAKKSNRALLLDAVTTALELGDGTLEVSPNEKTAEPIVFSAARVCPKCDRGFRELDPQDFSFRSKRGICKKCEGRGFLEKAKSTERSLCPACAGSRLGETGRNVYFNGKTIFELACLNAPGLLAFLQSLSIDERLAPIIEPIFTELHHRLHIITDVGLGYLSLNRESSSISGGEAQRLRLARTIGSPLSGICYILDEPTIGLHPVDHGQMLNTIFKLRDSGNTVVIVEHDEETIRAADYIIDMGPGGGAQGGFVVAEGSLENIINQKNSLTGQELKKRNAKQERNFPSKKLQGFIELTNASTNNLKNISVSFPLSALTVVAGVSGAGKSSLVKHTLLPALEEEFEGKKKTDSRTWGALLHAEKLEKFLEIDQSPVGKTSASTPASYLGIFNEIRSIFANLGEAKVHGWDSTFFSYNTGKGRCTVCEGKGFIRTPMSFMPDAESVCEECYGLRYNEEALSVEFQGFSIGALLKKTMIEARDILKNHKKIKRALDYVVELGIGYLTLGQPTHTLSGGEAQRLKIARELSSATAKNTLYVLDEPTTGLHMADIEKLLGVLHKLTAASNTVVVIEHNLDVINAADYIIELGPKPGDAGGQLLFSGTPDEFLAFETQTPTRQFLTAAEKALKVNA